MKPRFPLLQIDIAYENFIERFLKPPDRILVDYMAMEGIKYSISQMPYLTASAMGGYRTGRIEYRNVPTIVGMPVKGDMYSMSLYCDDSIEPMLVSIRPVFD